ncbi:AGE family epimerase/isomerase [bacterium]|nr:AGE family epimerase/isomerase [bacterium]
MRDAVRRELLGNILPFWMRHAPDPVRGGFRGRVSNDLVPDDTAPRGLIVNARILWTFSAAHRAHPDPAFLDMAGRAADALMTGFWDTDKGGAFWMLNPDGSPFDAKKKIYGQAFFIYALAEYVRTTGDTAALERGREAFGLVERHGYDAANTGYFETYERDWTLAADLRLSAKDLNEAKSMNTHLHLMEAYANLYRVWKDDLLAGRLRQLILNFRDRIIDREKNRMICFFNETWEPRSGLISFGHDIEASWLLCEAADTLGDPALSGEIRAIAVQMAEAVYTRGRDRDGSLRYEADASGIVDSDKHFWVQAEAVVGFLNAYRLSGDDRYLEAARLAWIFIDRHLVDRAYGDWIYRVDRNGNPAGDEPKISEWKCPYHSGRMCLEAEERLGRILEAVRKRSPVRTVKPAAAGRPAE